MFKKKIGTVHRTPDKMNIVVDISIEIINDAIFKAAVGSTVKVVEDRIRSIHLLRGGGIRFSVPNSVKLYDTLDSDVIDEGNIYRFVGGEKLSGFIHQI